jgi:hypothetical protein
MADLIALNSTSYPLFFFMADASDPTVGKTGLSPAVKISKNGGVAVTPTGTVSEVDSTNFPGVYKVAGNATDSNTVGPLLLAATATGAVAALEKYLVTTIDVLTLALNVGGGLPVLGGSETLDVNLAYINDTPAVNVSLNSGTADAGSTSTTIVLAAAASSTNSDYLGCVVAITGGTGKKEARVITGYVGATRTATVDYAWTTTPDNTTTYVVYLAVGVARTSSTLRPGDSSGVTTLLTDYTTARAAKLDNLDAAMSTRATPADVTSAVDARPNLQVSASVG